MTAVPPFLLSSDGVTRARVLRPSMLLDSGGIQVGGEDPSRFGGNRTLVRWNWWKRLPNLFEHLVVAHFSPIERRFAAKKYKLVN